MPKNPKEKTAFLTFPKTRNHVVNWKAGTRMAPSVMVLILMTINDVKQAAHNTKNRKGMDPKRQLSSL